MSGGMDLDGFAARINALFAARSAEREPPEADAPPNYIQASLRTIG